MNERHDENDPSKTTDGIPGIEFDEFWEKEFARTGNPLYVWQALNSLRVYGMLWAAHRGVSASTPPAIPKWCIEYLMDVASRVSDLSRGLDETLRPKDSADYSALVEWNRNPTLRPKNAARRLTRALRIDWGSFSKFSSTEKAAVAESLYQNLRADGVSAADAKQIVMKELQLTDERTLRRYFAEAKARGKPLG
jgi:hypothetical protein